jgi:hypothetical protein
LVGTCALSGKMGPCLADIKEINPMEVTEYAASKELQDEPAFAWWVMCVLKNRHHIIAVVTKCYHKRNHKFGIAVPKTWDDCIQLDKENSNYIWQDKVINEIKNVRISFKIINGNEAIPPTYQQITCHMIFTVRMEDFRHNAHLVSGGHATNTPHAMPHASIVSRESVRIELALADLKNSDVNISDIENAYLMAPITERVLTVLSPELGVDAGKRTINVGELCGLKSAGAALRNHIPECMPNLGWTSCCTDRDLWVKHERRPDDGVQYWAYILIYVDDILYVNHEQHESGVKLTKLDQYFKIKDGSIGSQHSNWAQS